MKIGSFRPTSKGAVFLPSKIQVTYPTPSPHLGNDDRVVEALGVFRWRPWRSTNPLQMPMISTSAARWRPPGGFQWDDGLESHEAPEFLTEILMISVYIGIISHKHDCIFVYDFCSFFVRPLIFW